MDDIVAQVNASYGRCCLSPSFFDDFYIAFFDASPLVVEKFAGTDMTRQKEVLRQGITYLIMYYKGSRVAKNKVEELAASHSRGRLDIAPDLYAIWEQSLLDTIDAHDGSFDPDLRKAWKTVLAKGISRIKAGYDCDRAAATRPPGQSL